MDSLIQKLKLIREDRKISYLVLERATGIRALKLQEAERGEAQLSIGEIDKLLAYYQMTAKQALRYRKLKLRKLILPGAALLLLIAIVSMIWLGAEQASPSGIAEPPPTLSIDGSVMEEGADVEAADDDGMTADGGLDRPSDVDGEAHPDADASTSDDADADTETNTDTLHNDELISEGDMEEAPSEPEGDDSSLGSAEHDSGDTVFRFWGNVDYDAAELPALEGNDQSNVIHIVPVTRLTDKRPDWLTDNSAGRYILNVGTADIWTDTTLQGWEALREDGIPVIGMGRLADVYEPHIVEVGEQKVGILSLAGLIHEANQIAYPSRIGLPRAYDNEEVRQAVQQAKEQVDYLFVVIHWGNLYGGETPIAKQMRLARVIAEAGGDFIVGNRSLLTQDISVINQTPVFYSLGRTISDESLDGYHRFVLDVHIGDGVEQLNAHVGTVQSGTLRFAPDSSAASSYQQQFEVLTPIIDRVQVH